MRRVILAIVATAAALVFLLSRSSRTRCHPGTAAASAARAAGIPGRCQAQHPGRGKRERPGGRHRQDRDRRCMDDDLRPGPGPDLRSLCGGGSTAVTALEYPSGTPEDEQINAFAIPQLNKGGRCMPRAAPGSSTVSGATYTSGGYIGSLQSALDKAGQ